MTQPARIWHCAAFFPVYRCGGWAFVRQSQGVLTGAAGGDRHATARRVSLLGLLAALKDLPPLTPADGQSPIRVQTNSLDLYAYADFIAEGLQAHGQDSAPVDDLDLWAEIALAARGRRLTLARAPMQANTPIAFAAAWAELGRDKAKATGPFAAPIPRTTLAKVQGLPST